MRSIDKGMLRIYLAGFFFIVISCSESEKNIIKEGKEKNTIQLFQWIEGSWVDTMSFQRYNPQGHFVEKWSICQDSISGIGIKVIDGDSTIIERMTIREIDGEFRYIARPHKQSMIPYVVDSISDVFFRFSNPAHDFPQAISYKKVNADSLTITLKGISRGGVVEKELQLKKIDF